MLLPGSFALELSFDGAAASGRTRPARLMVSKPFHAEAGPTRVRLPGAKRAVWAALALQRVLVPPREDLSARRHWAGRGPGPVEHPHARIPCGTAATPRGPPHQAAASLVSPRQCRRRSSPKYPAGRSSRTLTVPDVRPPRGRGAATRQNCRTGRTAPPQRQGRLPSPRGQPLRPGVRPAPGRRAAPAVLPTALRLRPGPEAALVSASRTTSFLFIRSSHRKARRSRRS